MKFKHLLSYSLIVLFVIGLSACSDSGSTSSGGGKEKTAPKIPDLSVVATPDVSFFDENDPQGTKSNQILDNQYSNFKKGSFITGFGAVFGTAAIYAGFLNPATTKEAQFKNGHWEWDYNASANGQNTSIRLTASDGAQSTKWALFISYDDGQGGGFQDYRLIDGTTSDGGAKGTWTFNVLSDDNTTETPAIVTDWVVSSKTKRTITSESYDKGTKSSSIIYEEDGPEHTLTAKDLQSSSSEEQVVFWNTDTRKGYVIDNGTKECWDENLKNTSCS